MPHQELAAERTLIGSHKMAYKYEEKLGKNHSSRGYYGYKSKPVGFTIHHWGSTGQSHNGVVNYLNRANGNTSAHAVISAGLVTRLVKDNRAAWHAGHRRGNGETIGIEMRPEMSDGDWDTLVEFCTDEEEIHGSMRYYRHSDWKATECPGKYASRIQELVEAVNAEHARRKNGSSKPAPKPAPKPKSKSVSTMASEVIAGKHGTGHANRRKSLGISNAQYNKVRAEVNRRAGVSTPKRGKSVSTMATEVIQGKHGTGNANRRKSLGISNAQYEKVRAEVNRRL